MRQKTVVVIDAGGRGAALVHKYSQSPQVMRILAIPGNDLMALNTDIPVVTYPALQTTSVSEIVAICLREHVSLVDVAQDNAVAAGLVDALVAQGIPVVGPTQKAGEIEWNKAFAREFLTSLGIHQPPFAIFHSPKDGISYLKKQPEQPWFVKASGLAEGKGALPAQTNEEAIARIIELQKFAKASETYLLEQWVKSTNGTDAEEFSAFAFCDADTVRLIGFAQDHKRVFDGDKGENTGGMGCSTPPLVITPKLQKQVEDILQKTIRGLHNLGRPYRGVIYLGGILINDSVSIIEFNARWGDPEAEVIVPGIADDFYAVSEAIARGDISEYFVTTDKKARVAVAAAAKGYPGDYTGAKGKEIFGLLAAKAMGGVTIYGAGVKKKGEKFYVNGGRLFYIVGEGNDIFEAREKAYRAMEKISIEGDNLHYRKDIGWRDMQRMKK